MQFVNDTKFWKLFCLVTFVIGSALFTFSLIFKEYESTIGFLGGIFLLIAWVGYCVFEGIKREQEFLLKEKVPCPYKVEASGSDL